MKHYRIDMDPKDGDTRPRFSEITEVAEFTWRGRRVWIEGNPSDALSFSRWLNNMANQYMNDGGRIRGIAARKDPGPTRRTLRSGGNKVVPDDKHKFWASPCGGAISTLELK